MKNKINFESLQRLDKVDANDLQENIYSQVEDLTQGMFRSGIHGIASQATKLDNAKRNGMHGPIIPIPSVSIDQANNLFTINDDFAVVERNTGDVITFDATDRAEGSHVISTATAQATVDADPPAYRQNDIEGGGFTALAIFAYPVVDTKTEPRNFFDVGSNATVSQNTTTRNRTRLSLFADIYEARKNITDANGNYPTLIGKWEFGRNEAGVRTDSGGGNFVLNPVVQWASSAGWISNLVWNWAYPDTLNVMQGTTHADRSLPNSGKLPNTITEPGQLRVADGGTATHDLRLMFKHVQRLIDRIQVAGASDPTTTDLGVTNNPQLDDSNQVVDEYGVLTGGLKLTNNSLHAEHPPYSLRGLKRFIDVYESNRPITSSVSVEFQRYTTDTSAFTDGTARATTKSVQHGPSGEFALGVLYDFYDVYTSSLGVAAPSSSDAQMALGNARASSITGVFENTSQAATVTAQTLVKLYRNAIISIPDEYAGYNVVGLSINFFARATATTTTFYGVGMQAVGPLQALLLTDDDDALDGAASGFNTGRPAGEALTQVKTIRYTDNQGVSSQVNGIRLLLGTNATFISALTQVSNKGYGFNISLTLRNNNTLAI